MNAAERPDVVERRFGDGMRAARTELGMSQADLARQMSDRGWPWHQQTVTRVEAGQRVVRLGEAKDIASILNTSVDALSGEDAVTRALVDAATAARKAWQHRIEGHHAWLRALSELRAQIKAARRLAERSERVDDALSFAEGTLLMAEDDPLAVRQQAPEGARDVTH